MMTLGELKRRLENIAQIGTISATKSQDGKALARVIFDDDVDNKRVSAFLPVVSIANSFVRVHVPIRVNEQVLVISPFGNANSGFIIRSIFNKACKEPDGSNEFTTVVEFEDGTRFSYDTKNKKLTAACVGDIEIIAKNITIKADNTNFDGGSVTHNGTTIDDTHDHTQNAGNHFGAGAITTAPNK
ncbi:MAG: hypothetical protein C0625_02105 [Arcobacter sp.]|nr:MAG: hypothetical protein C0625_02105 [Arcobacter sp.]